MDFRRPTFAVPSDMFNQSAPNRRRLTTEARASPPLANLSLAESSGGSTWQSERERSSTSDNIRFIGIPHFRDPFNSHLRFRRNRWFPWRGYRDLINALLHPAFVLMTPLQFYSAESEEFPSWTQFRGRFFELVEQEGGKAEGFATGFNTGTPHHR